jgi:hypothetical protein
MLRQEQKESLLTLVLLISKLAALNQLHLPKLSRYQLIRFQISLLISEVNLLTIGRLSLKINNGFQEQIILHKQMLKLWNILVVDGSTQLCTLTFSDGSQWLIDLLQLDNKLGQQELAQSQLAMSHHRRSNNNQKPQQSLKKKLMPLLPKWKRRRLQSKRRKRSRRLQLLHQLVVQLMSFLQFSSSVISGLVKLWNVKSIQIVKSFILKR